MSDIKKEEYVYCIPTMYWAFNFHGLMKKFYYFHVPKEITCSGEGWVDNMPGPSIN